MSELVFRVVLPAYLALGLVARAYGVLSVAGFPSRWTFYIGKDGRILDIDKNVQPSSHGADVARKLEQLGIPRV